MDETTPTRPRLRIVGGGCLLLLLLLLLGPFLIHLSPAPDTLPPTELADHDSQFIEVNELQVHYKHRGQGEPVFLLLHGFGASTFSWREVMASLAEMGAVVAYDRPAFGLTERPVPAEWSGDSPYGLPAQTELLIGLLDGLEIEQAILVGHSAGAAVAVQTALQHPQRVAGLILVAPAVSAGGMIPDWLSPLLHTPQADRIVPLLLRRFKSSVESRGQAIVTLAWHDPGRITPDIRAGYNRPLQAENWDRGLWELVKAAPGPDLRARLPEIDIPTLVISGDDDRLVPAAASMQAAEDMPGAELVIIPNCGHLPHEECPQAFMAAVGDADGIEEGLGTHVLPSNRATAGWPTKAPRRSPA